MLTIDTAPHPLVSVIMPVRNEALWIAQSVGAVLRQDYPACRMEIIVADGESDDATIGVIEQIPDAHRVRIISNPARIQAAGLNRAIRCARGEVIVRVDGHTMVARDYVSSIVSVMRETGVECVGGSIDPTGTTSMGRAIAVASHSIFAVPAHFRTSKKPGVVDTVYMGAWQRVVFDRIGEFDETLAVNEDYEFHYRLRRAGSRVYFTPQICSAYCGHETIRALARQYFRYGLWKPATLVKHPRSLKARHLAAPALALYLLVFTVLAWMTPESTQWFLPPLIAYGLLNLAFTVRSGWQHDWNVLLRLPWVFATIHLAWGCGFWFGWLRLLAAGLRRNLS